MAHLLRKSPLGTVTTTQLMLEEPEVKPQGLDLLQQLRAKTGMNPDPFDAASLAAARAASQREQDRLKVREEKFDTPVIPQERDIMALALQKAVEEVAQIDVNAHILERDSVASDDTASSGGAMRLRDLPSSGLWRTRANVGNWTGAIRPHYPNIRRPYGTNPREHFLGRRYTGMYQDGYDASVVESKACSPFIPPGRKVVQDGVPTITDYIPALRSGGSEHVFLGTNRRR